MQCEQSGIRILLKEKNTLTALMEFGLQTLNGCLVSSKLPLRMRAHLSEVTESSE